MKYLFFILVFINAAAKAGDTIGIAQLLRHVASLQPRDNTVFPAGSIPSYRTYIYNDWSKADPNAFYNGLVMLSLQNMQPQLTTEENALAKEISDRCAPVLSMFRNIRGRPTYNFWRTNPPLVFPNSGWINLMNRSHQLPDDMDDTVILLLAENASDSVVRQVHGLMQGYTNRNSRMNKGPKAYRKMDGYSTWFGVKMPVQFDACVLSNILYFVQRRRLTWTATDSASLQVLVTMIDRNDHLNIPHEISPNYGTAPLILYHLSRLMSAGHIPALEQRRSKLIDQARTALLNAPTFMDEVILGTALMRWGQTPPVTKPRYASNLTELVDDSPFYFFQANMMWMLPDAVRQTLGRLGQFYYYSAAYNNVLLAEHLAMRRKLQLQ